MIKKVIDYINPKIRAKIKLRYALFKYYFTKKVSFPNWIAMDVTNICNLKCPLCPTGLNKSKSKKIMMPFDNFKTIIDKLPSSIKLILLCDFGEPFLNPNIFEMINYIKKRKILTKIDSNFNIKKDDKFFKNIIISGLDILNISLDGCSQKIYEKYRIGGNLNLVISNIKRLVKIKKKLKSKNPKITWIFMVNRFNEHEIEKAKEKTKEIGINFRIKKMGLSDQCIDIKLDQDIEERKRCWLPRNKKYIRKCYSGKYKLPLYKSPCHHLFDTLFISANGNVLPCCYLSNESLSFGNILKESFEDVWNNNKYKYSRSLFSYNKYKSSEILTICSKCEIFKKLTR